VRKQLKLEQGSVIIARVEKEQLVLTSQAQALREAQAYFSQFRREGVSWADEIIKERREEALRELEG
jgi:hypothetical protein